MLQFITDAQINQKVILEQVPLAKKFLWIATSDLKDMYVNKDRKICFYLERILMKTIPMAKKFVTCDEKGNPTKVDIEGWIASLPMKERLAWIIPLMQHIQEEQYQGFKKFIGSTPGNSGERFSECFETMGRMYYVIHSMIDDYKKL